MTTRCVRCFLFFPVLAALLALANAAPAETVTRPLLSRHIPAAIERFHLRPIGPVASSRRLTLSIGLPMRNRAGFDELLKEIYDPASPEYHHYLTPAQITDRFGPTETDYAAVVSFAETNGFQIVRKHPGRALLTVKGTVAAIEKTFHVQMQLYQHPTEARTFFAPDREPSVNLSVPLEHISGLNDYFVPRPGGHPGGAPARQGAVPGSGSGPFGAFLGQDFRNAYVPDASLTGAGQTVGLLELDGYYSNDIASYETLADLPNVAITNVLMDGATGMPDDYPNSVGEVSLDMEMVIAMAPGISRLIVYEAPNDGTTWLDILAQMQEDDSAKQLSSSWLFDFDDPDADVIYQEFAMQGQSFFQCSGDDLAFYPYENSDQWTDDPNVTLVGGTMLATTNDGSWASETVWTNGDGVIGSGGGVSAPYMGNYAIPTWQQGINMTANGGSTTNRNVPDVAMVAYDAYVIWDDGQEDWWWGTSIAAPLWAGLTALANQQAAARLEPSLGFLNPALYAIGQGPLYSSCFHDITTGNNVNGDGPDLYYAVPGYDLCTGWGTPIGVNLINVLTQTPTIYGTERTANGALTFSLLCVPGSTNLVLATTNLAAPVSWTAISTNVAGSVGTWQFTDTNAPLYKTRFYRVLSYWPGR